MTDSTPRTEKEIPRRIHRTLRRARKSEATTLVRWTIAMAIASWVLNAISFWSILEQRSDARELLQSQIGAELDKEFDSAEIRRARRSLASQLLHKKDDVSDYRVLDFFEKVGAYASQRRIDEDTVYESFSYYLERYWLASQGPIREFRKAEHDGTYYTGFEDLYNSTLSYDAKRHHKARTQVAPSENEVKGFLEDEAALSD
jgi:hypothetical protein